MSNSGPLNEKVSCAETVADKIGKGKLTFMKSVSCTTSRRFMCEYTWVIQNFDCYQYQESITSPSFSAAKNSYEWFLKIKTEVLYDVKNNERSRYIDIYLLWTDEAVEEFGPASGNFELFLLDLHGKKVKSTNEIKFHTGTNGMRNLVGSSKFVREDSSLVKSILQQSSPPGTLTILCKLSFILLNDVAQISKLCSLTSPDTSESNPIEGFEKLFNSEEDSDVTIHANGKMYPAHKLVLSVRSPVFKAMFTHEMVENQKNRIDIKDLDEHVLEEMLRYIYTGKVQNLETVVFELFVAAEKYDLDKLKIMCKNKIHNMISEDTVLEILLFSDTYSLLDLKTRAIEYIQTHANEATKSTSWEWSDLTSRPNLMKDILEAFMK